MFEKEIYITVTGLNHYYNMKPFKIGSLVMLEKEPDNEYDENAVMVMAPLLGKVGYVSNTPYTTITGSRSADQIYEQIPQECAAVVCFMTDKSVIARLLPNKKLSVKIDTVLEDIKNDAYEPVTEDTVQIQ
jgi:hypothetical protein